MVIKIFQWNSRSLISNGQDFKHFISNSVDKPHVICIQETWLKPEINFVLHGYIGVRRDRDKRWRNNYIYTK